MTRVATSRPVAWILLAVLLALLPLSRGTAADDPPTVTPTADTDPTPPPPLVTPAKKAPVVAYLKLEDQIDDLQYDYMKRSLETAKERGADIVVVHIHSPGGTVFHSELISTMLLIDKPRMVAFVDDSAWSGGALVAYSCEEIYITNKAKIGDIGVITKGPDGQPKRPEIGDKANAPVRTHFKIILAKRNWPDALFMKMTDWDRPVYRVWLPDETVVYVIDRDGALGEFKRAHPDLKDDQYELVYKEDELLSLGGDEAVKLGMATATVENLDDLYARLGVAKADVIDLAPTPVELTARSLRPWASILMGLAILFIIFEMKTPGVGLWAGLATLSGVGFLVCQYYLHFTNNLEVVVLLLGLAMIGVDLYFGLTGGVMAVAGGFLFLIATFATFMPDSSGWDWHAPAWTDAFGRALMYSAITMCFMLVGLGIFIAALPHLPWISRLSVTDATPATVPGTVEALGATLRGQMVFTTSGLHPGGSITIDGIEHSARSEYGGYIPAGTRVVVVDSSLGEIIVRPAEPVDVAPVEENPA